MPEPVGAWISTCAPLAIAGQPCDLRRCRPVEGALEPVPRRLGEDCERVHPARLPPGLLAQVVRREGDHHDHREDREHDDRDAAEDDRRRARALTFLGLVLEALDLLDDTVCVIAASSRTCVFGYPGAGFLVLSQDGAYRGCMSDHTFTRRSTLAKFGGIVAAAAGGRALLTDDAAGGNLAVESGAVACVLTPELTEGPYYIAGEKLRRDIREGHPGRCSACGCAC